MIMIRLIGKGEGKRRFKFMFGLELPETRLNLTRAWLYAASYDDAAGACSDGTEDE